MLPRPKLRRLVYPKALLIKSHLRSRRSPPASVWSFLGQVSQESVYCRFTTDHSQVAPPTSAPPVAWLEPWHLSLPAPSFLWPHSATGGGTPPALKKLTLTNHSPPACFVWS